MENYKELIAEIENDNKILEINMSVLGDSDGTIFQMILENEKVINILNDMYSK